MNAPLVQCAGVVKAYGGLRPLRIADLCIGTGDHVAVLGLDRAAAEILVNMVSGAVLPDQGEVRVFGRATTDIADAAEWLATVDRFGIVSERAVLLEALTVIQNLAVPFSLEIEPPPDTVRAEAERLAQQAGLPRDCWETRVGDLDAAARVRVRLGRALALGPQVLLLEHVTAEVPPGSVTELARAVRRVAEEHGMATLTLTADTEFARLVGTRVLTLEPASGRLRSSRRSTWFTRRPPADG